MSSQSLDCIDDELAHHPFPPGSVGSEEADQILDQSFSAAPPAAYEHQSQEVDLGLDSPASSRVYTLTLGGVPAPASGRVQTQAPGGVLALPQAGGLLTLPVDGVTTPALAAGVLLCFPWVLTLPVPWDQLPMIYQRYCPPWLPRRTYRTLMLWIYLILALRSRWTGMSLHWRQQSLGHLFR